MLISCSAQSPQDFYEETHAVVEAIISELHQIRSRDDLVLHTKQLQQLFTSLAQLMIRAQEFKKHHPHLDFSSLFQKYHKDFEQFHFELNRILYLEGGRSVIESAQNEARELLMGSGFVKT